MFFYHDMISDSIAEARLTRWKLKVSFVILSCVIFIIQGYCVSYIVLHLSLKDMLIEVFEAHNYCYVGVEFYIELIIWSHH